MALNHTQLLELHAKALHNLEIKVSKIPARAFASGRKPTIQDIYERPHTLQHPQVHPKLQLAFVFANYNSFAAADFRARKLEQHMNITMSIFYWQMDPCHSLTHMHRQIRFNVLLAHIVISSPTAKQDLEPALHRFLEHFLMASLDSALGFDHSEDVTRDYFIAHVWKTGPYDFVYWRSSQLRRMTKAVKTLQKMLPQCSVSGEEFWETACRMPPEEHRKHCGAWALQYIIYLENQVNSFDAEERLAKVEDNLQSGEFAVDFSGLSMSDEAPSYLCQELFEREEVQALLVDVDEVTVQ